MKHQYYPTEYMLQLEYEKLLESGYRLLNETEHTKTLEKGSEKIKMHYKLYEK